MTFNLSKLFLKQTINEPMLELDDPKWGNLEGAYRALYNASDALNKLEQTNDIFTINEIYEELWNELHHQGDVGLASYYSVPHLTRIAKEKQIVNSSLLSLISVIEIQGHKNNPKLPSALLPAYNNALIELGELANLSFNQPWDFELANASLTAIAISKGQIKLANAILNLDSEDTIDEFLEKY